jgi:hypothetical protein
LIQTCKLNGVEPLAYLTDIPQRIVSGRTKNHELHECCRGTGVRHPQSPPRNHPYDSLPRPLVAASIARDRGAAAYE